ncbi:MAG: hypothetical protein QOJ25_965 [Solirubrobacteraceae bacterium]|nr:hypothetical protein [Solirubrobacteraceae bacterium]
MVTFIELFDTFDHTPSPPGRSATARAASARSARREPPGPKTAYAIGSDIPTGFGPEGAGSVGMTGSSIGASAMSPRAAWRRA